MRGDGAGNLTASKNSPYATGSLPRALAAGDFNSDGLSDVAIANYNDGTITVLLNTYATGPCNGIRRKQHRAGRALVAGHYLWNRARPGIQCVGHVGEPDGRQAVLCGPVEKTYVSPTQINAMVPAQAAPGPASFTVTVPQSGPQRGTIAVAAVAPGLFSANSSGKGPAAGYIQTLAPPRVPLFPVFTCSSPTVCAPNPFDVSTGTTSLVLYGTGIRNRTQLSAVTVNVGGVSLPAFYAGLAPNFAGVDQVNVALPASLAHAGTVFVQVVVGSAASNQVTVQIQ